MLILKLELNFPSKNGRMNKGYNFSKYTEILSLNRSMDEAFLHKENFLLIKKKLHYSCNNAQFSVSSFLYTLGLKIMETRNVHFF